MHNRYAQFQGRPASAGRPPLGSGGYQMYQGGHVGGMGGMRSAGGMGMGLGGKGLGPGRGQGMRAPMQRPPKREMDSLLEEIKAKQRLQAEAARSDAQTPAQAPMQAQLTLGGALSSGPRPEPPRQEERERLLADEGPEERCLLFKELPKSITEDSLCALCSRYGVVCSVDLLHGLNGDKTKAYVVLDTRENAQRAKDALQDRDVDGVALWIEWTPGLPSEVSSRPGSSSARRVIVTMPSNAKRRKLIDHMAKYVAQEGYPFEQIVMDREGPEGRFGFLFQPNSAEGVYYRWRVLAFTQGDNQKLWRNETFRIFDGGSWWTPPRCERAPPEKKRCTNFSSKPETAAVPEAPAAVVAVPKPPPGIRPARTLGHWTPRDVDEERDRLRLEERATQERQKRDRDRRGISGGKRLSDMDWDRLEQLLRSVTRSKASILETMVFCIDRADMAIEITECITESLAILETDVHLKLARLCVVNDILHNTSSSKQGVSAYRRELEQNLPDVFENLHISFSRMESQHEASKAREAILRILAIWADWGVFSQQYINGLEAALVVGVKSLRNLRARGDSSREPPWLDLKLVEWRKQHFSQLEKMCRLRGLRSSTAHLDESKERSLEDARKDWLLDRMVCYELYGQEKEQEKIQEKLSLKQRRKSEDAHARSERQLKKEQSQMASLDGAALADADLDGEALDLDEPAEIIALLEQQARACAPQQTLGGCGPGVPLLLYSGGLAGSALLSEDNSEDLDGEPIGNQGRDDSDLLDIEKPQDPKFEDHSDSDAPNETESSAPLDRNVLRGIELDIVEMRASMELRGLHRDAIDDTCEEKRRRLIAEHKAALVSPAVSEKLQAQVPNPTRKSPVVARSQSKSEAAKEPQNMQAGKEKEKEKAKERLAAELKERQAQAAALKKLTAEVSAAAKEKQEKANSKHKELRDKKDVRTKDKEDDRGKQKERDKGKEARSKTKSPESKSRAKSKGRTRSHSRDAKMVDKSKESTRKRSRSRSASHRRRKARK